MKKLLLSIMCALTSLGAFAQADTIEDDLYVGLYAARRDRQQAKLAQQKAELELAQLEFSRTAILLQKNAASKSEYDIANRNLKLAQAIVLEIEAGVKEAQVLYQIAKDRVSAGLDMPICAELR